LNVTYFVKHYFVIKLYTVTRFTIYYLGNWFNIVHAVYDYQAVRSTGLLDKELIQIVSL